MSKQIHIYSTPTCHFCHMLKDFLTEKNIAFTDFNVAEDAAKREEMLQKTGQMGVPVSVFSDVDDAGNVSNEQIVIGFDQPKIKELLGIA